MLSSFNDFGPVLQLHMNAKNVLIFNKKSDQNYMHQTITIITILSLKENAYISDKKRLFEKLKRLLHLIVLHQIN